MYSGIGAPLYIPFVIFMFFYYRKTGQFPAPIAIFTSPFMSLWGLPTPSAPAPPTPTPPTPDCPTCPTCPTRTHHPEAEEWAKNLLKDYAIDELKLMPVQVTFSMSFNYPNEPTTFHETHKLAPMPANQLPMAQLMLKTLIADANATGKVNVQITNITVKPVPDRHFQPAVIQEAEAWASQKLTGHQLPFN